MAVKKTGSLDAVSQLRRYAMNVQALSGAELRALEARAQSGDSAARDRLVESCLIYVVSMAMNFQRRGVPLDELINLGNEALVGASRRFDGTRGASFSTFAGRRIRGAMMDALRSNLRWGLVGRSEYEKHQRIVEIEERLTAVLERRPTAGEIADQGGGLDIDDVAKYQQLVLNQLSLDALVYSSERGNDGDDSDVPLVDTIESPDPWPDEAIVERSDITFVVHTAWSVLTAQQMMVLYLYYGLAGCIPITLKEIAEVMELSESRVSQLRTRAVEKLKGVDWIQAEHNGNGSLHVPWAIDQETDIAVLAAIDRLTTQLGRAPIPYEVSWELHGQIKEWEVEAIAQAADARERVAV
ncbi:MAG: sigma-70 family RNA polymerase sigma factor [Parcubacteria group bacterium]|nr:sigma-70 family RNA polymerase sigma factor [Parcubacteria group bacterium]MBI2636723.1 sigma-70 family RNA polymerase sigma factor [Parcubacteria group bacterium]